MDVFVFLDKIQVIWLPQYDMCLFQNLTIETIRYFLSVSGRRRVFSFVVVFEPDYVIFIKSSVGYFEDNAVGFLSLYSVSRLSRNFYGLSLVKNKEFVVNLYVRNAAKYFPEF